MDRAMPGSTAWLGGALGPEAFEDETIRESNTRLRVENPSRWWWWWTSSLGENDVLEGRRPWLEPDPPLDYETPPDTLPNEWCYDPALLIAELRLEPAGRTEVAGREGFLVKALPRPTIRAGGMEFLHLDPPADEYELVVDAELGVVLRLTGTLDGAPMDHREVREIAFEPPDGGRKAPDPSLVELLELLHLARTKFSTASARVRQRNRGYDSWGGTAPGRSRDDVFDVGLERPEDAEAVFRRPEESPLGNWQQCAFDPNVIVPESWLQVVGAGVVAGRDGIHVRGRLRRTTHDYFVLPMMTDEYDFVVDRQRGVLLRLACIADGQEASVYEIQEIDFDRAV
jgi:hypothetical protein